MNKTLQLLLTFTFLLLALLCQAQAEYVKDNYLRYDDYVYQKNIGAVTFHPTGEVLDMPVYQKNSPTKLLLTFDDLDADIKDYSYTIIHCNKDWTPSDLTEFDYIDGFSTDELTEYEYSFGTMSHYTHYTLEIPNENMGLTLSGNYLLKIYNSDDENQPVITRRFMIYEDVVTMDAELRRANDATISRTHQEINFILNYKGINVRDARTDLHVVVLQNGRWDNAVTDIKPAFTKPSQLIFDFPDDLLFPAGKEFRVADLGSTRYKAEHIMGLENDLDRYYMTVIPDKPRDGKLYDYLKDANGRFFIDNYHETNPHLESEYVTTTFTLVKPFPFHDGNVYLFGALSEWRPQEQFKMKYDEQLLAYQCTVKLKQGYYSYAYALVKDGSSKADMSPIEGDFYQAENDYQILVYFRPFGERYDRLVGFRSFSTKEKW